MSEGGEPRREPVDVISSVSVIECRPGDVLVLEWTGDDQPTAAEVKKITNQLSWAIGGGVRVAVLSGCKVGSVLRLDTEALERPFQELRQERMLKGALDG